MGNILSFIIPVIGAFLGGPLGYAIGTMIAGALFSRDIVQQGSRVSDFQVQNAESGIPIPVVKGRMKISGNIIWQRGFQEHKRREKVASGGWFGSDQYLEIFYYSNIVAVGLTRNGLTGIKRIWFDGKLVQSVNGQEKDEIVEYNDFFNQEDFLNDGEERYVQTSTTNINGFRTITGIPVGGDLLVGNVKGDRSWNYTTFLKANKEKSEHIISKQGDDLTPIFKNLSYMVFRFGDLTDWGHRIPQIEVEVVEKTLDNEIEVMSDEEVPVIVSKEERKYENTNILNLLKQTDIEQASETINQNYLVTFGVSGYQINSRNVLTRTYNEVNRDIPNVLSISFDTRWSLRQNGFVYDNGVKEIRLNTNSSNVLNSIKNFTNANTSTAYFNSENVQAFRKIESRKAPVYSNSNELFTIDNIETGKRLRYRVITNSDFTCDFVIDDYKIYSAVSEDIQNIKRRGLEIITPINSMFIQSIDNRRVVRHIDYNNRNPILLCLNDNNTRAYFYTISVNYDTDTGRYTYSTTLSKTINITQYLSSGGGRITFSSGPSYIYLSYFNGSNSQRNKYYFDPRFKVFIEFNIKNVRIYKDDGGNLFKLFYNETNSTDRIIYDKNRDIFNKNRDIFNIYTTYKNGLNICIQYIDNFNSTEQTADLYETNILLSYWKDGRVPSDFTTYLDECVEEMLIDSGYKEEDIDMSNLSDIKVDSFIYGDGQATRLNIERLQAAYQFNIIEEDWKFVAKRRGQGVDRELSLERDIGYNIEATDVKISRMITSSTELPTKIHINYASLNDAYMNNTQTASFEDNHLKEITVELPMGLTDNQAAQIADINLAVAQREIYRFDFSVSLEHIDLNIGDLLSVDGEIMRITQIDVNDINIRIIAVSDALSAYFSNVLGTSITQDIVNRIDFEQVLELVSFQATALDIELYEDQRPRIYYTALGNQNTVSTGLLLSSINNTNYEEEEPISIRSGFGGTVIENNIRNNYGFDTSELIVDFNIDVNVESVSKGELFNNRYLNLIAVIHTKNDVEFIQFKDAEKVEGTERTYRLTNLLRGRFNSLVLNIDQGTKFVVIGDNLYTKSFNTNRLNTFEYNKLLSSYITASEAVVDTNIITGENLRPREPLLVDYFIENDIISIEYNAISKVNDGWNGDDISHLTFFATSFDINDNILEEKQTKDLFIELDELNVDRVEIYTIDDNNGLRSKRNLEIQIGA